MNKTLLILTLLFSIQIFADDRAKQIITVLENPYIRICGMGLCMEVAE